MPLEPSYAFFRAVNFHHLTANADLYYRALPASLKPLAEKFYRAHHSVMRAHHTDRIWVAQQGEIAAALCLRPVEAGVWLTSLLVAPPLRRQGIASRLIEHALAGPSEPVWLFCHPQLAAFYLRLGFAPCDTLPHGLDQRLQRYRRSKQLVALMRAARQ